MRNPLLLIPVLLAFAACSSETPPPTGAAEEGAAAPEDVVVASDTRLVENPPTYPSTPLPEGLEWLTNEDDPVFASPEAKRGGEYRTYITGFPLTLRGHGPDANSDQYVSVKRSMNLALLDLHPNTLKFIPSLATHWAFGTDGKTVYFKLDPRARWSDGEPVTADDYVFAREMRLSDFIVDPYGKNYFTTQIVNIAKHDDHTISVTTATPRPPDEMLYEHNLSPEARHFHKLDADWVTSYDWRPEPTTGAYHAARVVKGRFLELERTENWWGDDLKYNRNRFNVDKIRIEVIRDDDVALQHFFRGELDAYALGIPERWHEKAVGEPLNKGYIHKIQFYNDVPREARGMWLNMDVPLLGDKNVRYGIAYAMNYDAVLRTVMRGDYQRLRMPYEGYYWGYSNPTIQPRGFDLALADQYFKDAGWTQRGPDGIRTKDGQRLEVRVSYASPDLSPQLVLMREEAKKAGLELNLQQLDPSTWGTQLEQKKHEIVMVGFSTGLTPSFWQHYHSENAHKPQTNNITNMDDPALDKLIDEYENASILDRRLELSHEIQEIVYETADYIPSYKIPYVREAYWRWIKLPESHGTRISSDSITDPFSAGLLWIDEDVKKETLEARDAGRAFEPVTIVDETWRVD
jgi:microcin C transport system substrate-binding protein